MQILIHNFLISTFRFMFVTVENKPKKMMKTTQKRAWKVVVTNVSTDGETLERTIYANSQSHLNKIVREAHEEHLHVLLTLSGLPDLRHLQYALNSELYSYKTLAKLDALDWAPNFKQPKLKVSILPFAY